MTPKEFIEFRLSELKPEYRSIPNEELADFIYKTLMSKKFRKYSVTSEYQDYIKNSITNSIENNLPIRFSFPFGGYKLWRFEETPEADWAELFMMMYYAKWVKAICEVYRPGVLIDFVSDDVIVERMNNIPKEDTKRYRESFLGIIAFLEAYIPKNLKFTFTPIASFYTDEEFEIDLADKIEKKKEEFGGLPELDDKQRGMVELNVRLNPHQDEDPLWREKVELIHQAYYTVDKRRPYSRAPHKIILFPYPLKDGKSIAVGTTKTSVAKFWVGVGALKKIDGKYLEYITSPSQHEALHFVKKDISIDGLSGKNFGSIKVFG
jgi:hypothetical protein